MTLPDDSEASGSALKPFIEHLVDLRNAILRSLAAIAVGMCVAIPLAPRLLSWLKIPLQRAGKDPAEFLRVIQVTGGISIAMTIILWTGVLLSAPFVVFFVCQFVFPGLKEKERRAVVHSMGFAVLLFAIGVVVGYVLLLRVTLQWMFSINDWLGVQLDFVLVNDYVSFVLKLLLAMGLAFEFPVVILALARLGLVSHAFLADKRRHVVILLLILSAIITPTVDPVTQTILAAPLYVLYEMCVWLLWWMEKESSSRASGQETGR